MNCKEVSEFLADYLDGALPTRQRWLFSFHLLLCRDCRRYLASYKETIRLAKAQRQTSNDSDLPPIPDELVRAILATRGQSQFTPTHDET